MNKTTAFVLRYGNNTTDQTNVNLKTESFL